MFRDRSRWWFLGVREQAREAVPDTRGERRSVFFLPGSFEGACAELHDQAGDGMGHGVGEEAGEAGVEVDRPDQEPEGIAGLVALPG